MSKIYEETFLEVVVQRCPVKRVAFRNFAKLREKHLGQCLFFGKVAGPTQWAHLRRFDVEIQRGKFVEITSILKGDSTWKSWHPFEVEISTWI